MNSINQWKHDLLQPSIGRRLAIVVLVFSLAATIVSTALQLALEYQHDVDEMKHDLANISESYSQSLANSLWITSKKDLQLQLDGILRLPDMQYIEVTAENKEVLATAGSLDDLRTISHDYPLNFTHRDKQVYLGNLHIVASLAGEYQRLKSKFAVILLTEGLKTFLVSLLILYLFHALVGRHLKKIAEFSDNTQGAKLQDYLDLNRPTSNATDNDELSRVVSSINEMKIRLEIYFQELHESEFRWKFAIEGSGDGLWDWNMTDNTLFLTTRWKEMIGYSDNEIGNGLEEFTSRLHPDDKSATYAALQNCIEGKTPIYFCEYRFCCKDGSYIWMSDHGTVVSRDAVGKATRMIGSHRDITEQKTAEEREKQLNKQLLQATKMESIGHLTGGIAHDFNNILGAIMGYAELSKVVLSADPDAVKKIPRYIDEILTGSERAKQLIAQMLAFSRLSSEMKDSPSQAVMLTPVLKEVVSLLRSSIPSTISLNWQLLRADLKARIAPIKLHQVMLNLGINARDAIGEYGSIDFILGTRLVDAQICAACHKEFSGNFVDIAVKDSGAGIPENILFSIFDPFFTTKDVGKGTGMGLSVVHGIVHKAGGHIFVETGIGKGTTFHILLPLPDADAEEIQSSIDRESDPEQGLSGLRLMVVDDEKAITSMLLELLEIHGAKVSVFNEPIKALEAFSKNPEAFDLVITDETMPNLSGMHLSEQLLKLRPGLPVILCTGYSDRANADSTASIGIAGFMHKPLDTAKLIRKISELAQKR